MVTAIGSKVTARGFEFRVIANEEYSNYGYCPEGAVIARNNAGATILWQSEYTVTLDAATNGKDS